MKTQLTTNPLLQNTLNGVWNHATMIGSGVSSQQANEIAFESEFHHYKRTHSSCCDSEIMDGRCSYCLRETENLL